MTLHDRIKSLDWVSEPGNREALLERQSDYADGLCDGANGAAMLAKEADELMAEMAEALEQAATSMQDSGYKNDSVVVMSARQAIKKYKERTK